MVSQVRKDAGWSWKLNVDGEKQLELACPFIDINASGLCMFTRLSAHVTVFLFRQLPLAKDESERSETKFKGIQMRYSVVHGSIVKVVQIVAILRISLMRVRL